MKHSIFFLCASLLTLPLPALYPMAQAAPEEIAADDPDADDDTVVGAKDSRSSGGGSPPARSSGGYSRPNSSSSGSTARHNSSSSGRTARPNSSSSGSTTRPSSSFSGSARSSDPAPSRPPQARNALGQFERKGTPTTPRTPEVRDTYTRPNTQTQTQSRDPAPGRGNDDAVNRYLSGKAKRDFDKQADKPQARSRQQIPKDRDSQNSRLTNDTPRPRANTGSSRASQYVNPQSGRSGRPSDVAGVTSDGRQLRNDQAATYTRPDGSRVVVHDRSGNVVPSDHRQARALIDRQIDRDNRNQRFLQSSGAARSLQQSSRSQNNGDRTTIINNYNDSRRSRSRYYDDYDYGRSSFFEGYIAGRILGRSYYDPYYDNNPYYYPGCYGWCGTYYYPPPITYFGPVNIMENNQVVVREIPADNPELAREVAAEVLRQQRDAEAKQRVAPSKEEVADVVKQKAEEFEKMLSGEVKVGGIFKVPDSEKDIAVKLVAASGDFPAGAICKLEYSGTLVVESIEGEGDSAVAIATYTPAQAPEGTECPAPSKVRVLVKDLSTYNTRFKENVAKAMEQDAAPEPSEEVGPAPAPAKRPFWKRWFSSKATDEGDTTVVGASRPLKREPATPLVEPAPQERQPPVDSTSAH